MSHRPRPRPRRPRAAATRCWSRRWSRDGAPSPALLGRDAHAPDRRRGRRDARRAVDPTRARRARRRGARSRRANADASLALSGTSDAAIDEAIDAGVLVEDGTHARVQSPDLRAHRVRPRVDGDPPRPAPRSRRHPARAARGRAPPRRRRRGHRRRRARARARRRATTRSPAASGTRRPATTRPRSTHPQAPEELAELHRRAGLSRRGNLQLAQAVTHFEAALELLGRRRRRRDPHRAAPLAHPLRASAPTRCSTSSRDRGPLEALVDEVEADDARAGGRGAGRAVAVVLGRVAHEAGDAVRASGRWRSPTTNDDHSAYARATTALSVPQWARYDLRGSLATLEDGVGARTRRGTTTRCSRAGRCSACRSCSRGSGASTRPRRARSSAATSPTARSTRWSSACRSPRSRRLAVARGEYDQAEQYAHRALLLQRLSGYHWAAGLFLPAARVRARRARPVRAGARRAGHLVGDRRRARAGQRRPLLPLGHRVRASPRRARRAPPRAAAAPDGGRRRVGGAGGRARAAGRRDR